VAVFVECQGPSDTSDKITLVPALPIKLRVCRHGHSQTPGVNLRFVYREYELHIY
jgi:hypothetical protein